jgi:hypothetical protein
MTDSVPDPSKRFAVPIWKSDFQDIFLSLPLKKPCSLDGHQVLRTATRAESAKAEVRANLNPSPN